MKLNLVLCLAAILFASSAHCLAEGRPSDVAAKKAPKERCFIAPDTTKAAAMMEQKHDDEALETDESYGDWKYVKKGTCEARGGSLAAPKKLPQKS